MNISMSDDEQKKIIEVPREVRRPSGPRLSGTGKYGTAQTIEMTKFAQRSAAPRAAGHHAVLPHPAQKSRRKTTSRAPARAVGDDFDIILYSNPASAAISSSRSS